MGSWEFGNMVRRRREGVAPQTVGLPVGTRRRATGLRREELAGLAGISTDYLTRLEQGRATAPSTQVIEALARALRLPDQERELLFRLAGHVAPGPGIVPTRISASVQRLLDRLAHTPVAVFDASFDLLVANAPYDALMGETSALRGPERNAVWRNLVGPRNRVVHVEAEFASLIAQQVAELRRTVSRYPADRRLHRLVDGLTAASPRFAELWAGADPVTPTEPARRKRIAHPSVGELTLDCDTLLVAGDDLRIMIYTAEPGTEDAEKLDLAIVLGTQALTG
ncbi:helix-turn-helix domain-containing protein [Nakamurella sp. YIM 132087]|uniref:Helix-turn-helix domain-containing protein n=1 Tax=Nakamurella alba TaxID=2665158 RepID=A0A7K1FLQ2_9ACTN|nr:helix-turn-helix transcriptional regulator [Nakamurella alba]MTD15036.1 helix-turn-helix domain-containing protein [Nakamurella alba]